MEYNIDSSFIAEEAYLSMLEYVSESAKFEIDNGHIEYRPIYEKASSDASSANDSWLTKLVSKVKNVCKSLIAKAKFLIKQIATKIRLKKATKLAKKLDNSDSNLYLDLSEHENKTIKIGTLHFGSIGVIPLILQKYDQGSLGSIIESSPEKFSEVIRNDSVIKKLDEFKYQFLGMPKSISSKDKFTKIHIDAIRQYMDSAVSYLSRTINASNSLKSEVSKLKNEGIDIAKIRYGMYTMFNLLMSCVTEYYQVAASLANYFLKHKSQDEQANTNKNMNANNDNANVNNQTNDFDYADEPKRKPIKFSSSHSNLKAWHGLYKPSYKLREAVYENDVKTAREEILANITTDPLNTTGRIEKDLQYVLNEGLDVFEPHDSFGVLRMNPNQSVPDEIYAGAICGEIQADLSINFSRERFEYYLEMTEKLRKSYGS